MSDATAEARHSPRLEPPERLSGVPEKPVVEILEKGKDVDGHPVSDGSGVRSCYTITTGGIQRPIFSHR